MAFDDIRPWKNTTGGELRLNRPVAASQTFLRGEPVITAAIGALNEAASDPVAIAGIAAHAPIAADGTSWPANSQCTIIAATDTQIFRCDNFATDGAGTLTTPLRTHIDELAGLILAGNSWVVDTGANNLILRIDEVLDANLVNIGYPPVLTGAGVTVLFRFI